MVAQNLFDETRLHRHGDEMKPVIPNQNPPPQTKREEPAVTAATSRSDTIGTAASFHVRTTHF
jgi:hypothetical protein